jgi:multicomponent Na+:H+ antiporter subunit F
MLLLAAGAGLLIAMALMIVRAIMGPSHYDRILAANSFGTKAVLFIALMKFFRYRSLQAPLTQHAADKPAEARNG